MASLLDLGLIQLFDFVFPVLLVWAFVFAMLSKTKVLGDSVGVNSLIAAVAGLTILLSRTVIDLINFVIPWFAVSIIFFVLMLLLFMIMGAKGTDAYKDVALQRVLIAVGILIMVAGAANVLGQSVLEKGGSTGDTLIDGDTTSGDFEQNIYSTVFHPKILGLLIVFTIMIFAVALLSG
jgi:hypothetical protein